MPTLRVILDHVGDEHPRGIGRYALELTRELISTAPRGSDVAGVVPASPEGVYEFIGRELPGLSALHKSALDRRQLAAVWQHGFTRLPGSGMVHAPSLLAPLSRHDRVNNPGEQFVVTIHDAAAWTHPETLPAKRVAWNKAMAKRAERYADAVVVPTHAVGDELSEVLDLGDRVRVIAGAPSTTLDPGNSIHSRSTALGLPDQYILSVGALDRSTGVIDLVWAMAESHAPGVPLVLVGVTHDDLHELEQTAHVDAGRLVPLGTLNDTDLAVAYRRASVAVVPSIATGFGLPALEAMSLGTPVVHSDAPALLEVCADAGLVVERDSLATYPERLAQAVQRVLDDSALADELRVRGRDRAGVYSWRDSAEKVWQLHADL